jgi:hypothetical protein
LAALLVVSAFVASIPLAAAAPALEGYTDFATLSKQVAELVKPGLCTVASLTKSPGGRDVWLITIGRGEVDKQPAILIVGNVEAAHLIGSELVVRIARRLVETADQEATKELVGRYTFYIIPRPNPDGSEAFFRSPRHARGGNDRRTDDDRDHQIGEDPPDDLNGDGVTTMMRVADPAGKHMPHAEDSRVMIEADAKKNETGRFTLYIEGKDDDHDEQFNEDGSGGISFNRNWTFNYPYFKPGAGPHQVSEPEARAIADFAYNHPNIAAVFCFSPEDNLTHPWKAADNQGRIKTSIQKDDAAHVDYIAEQYRKLHGGKDAPPSPAGEGSFSQWAYFHYGRWSLAARGWWIPKIEPEKQNDSDQKRSAVDGTATTRSDASESADKKSPVKAEVAQKGEDKKPTETRGAAEVNALRWLEREKIEGFVPWTSIEHPDFPKKSVEIGGFMPFVLLNPPAKELDSLAEKHSRFLVEFLKLMPKLEVADAEVEPLGGGVHRISCEVFNSGYLPTMSEMGQVNGAAYPVQIELQLPGKTTFLKGTPRSQVDRLAGRGGKSEVTWLIRIPDGKPVTGKIVVYAPAVGRAETSIELKTDK